MRFNTAISKLMVFAREIARDAALPREAADVFLRLLCPVRPPSRRGALALPGARRRSPPSPGPTADAALLERDVLTLAVQVNGKRRDEIEVPADADEETIRGAALASEKVQRHLGGREVRKVILVPGRLVNVVG